MLGHAIRMVAKGEIPAQPVKLGRFRPFCKAKLSCDLLRVNRGLRMLCLVAFLIRKRAIGSLERIVRKGDSSRMQLLDHGKVVDRDEMRTVLLLDPIGQELIQDAREIW